MLNIKLTRGKSLTGNVSHHNLQKSRTRWHPSEARINQQTPFHPNQIFCTKLERTPKLLPQYTHLFLFFSVTGLEVWYFILFLHWGHCKRNIIFNQKLHCFFVLSYAHNHLHLFSFLHIIYFYFTENNINNRKIFLLATLRKISSSVFHSQLHWIVFCFNNLNLAKNPIINN